MAIVVPLQRFHELYIVQRMVLLYALPYVHASACYYNYVHYTYAVLKFYKKNTCIIIYYMYPNNQVYSHVLYLYIGTKI